MCWSPWGHKSWTRLSDWAISCIHPFCEPLDYSLPGSSVHGVFQARILEWLPFPSEDLPDPGIEPASPILAGGFFTTRATWKALNEATCGKHRILVRAAHELGSIRNQNLEEKIGNIPRVRTAAWSRYCWSFIAYPSACCWVHPQW